MVEKAIIDQIKGSHNSVFNHSSAGDSPLWAQTQWKQSLWLWVLKPDTKFPIEHPRTWRQSRHRITYLHTHNYRDVEKYICFSHWVIRVLFVCVCTCVCVCVCVRVRVCVLPCMFRCLTVHICICLRVQGRTRILNEIWNARFQCEQRVLTVTTIISEGIKIIEEPSRCAEPDSFSLIQPCVQSLVPSVPLTPVLMWPPTTVTAVTIHNTTMSWCSSLWSGLPPTPLLYFYCWATFLHECNKQTNYVHLNNK